MITAEKLPNCHAICKCVPILSPTHRRFRGYRLVAARPNLAATHPRTKKRIPSFQPAYQMYILGDFLKWPTAEHFERFEAALRSTMRKCQKIHWVITE